MSTAKYKLTEQRKEWTGSTRAFNNIVKGSMADGGAWWVNNILPLHFGQGAADKYGYPRPSQKTLQAKINAGSRVWDRNRADWFPSTKPPEALVWSGWLKQFVLANIQNGQIIQKIKTDGRTDHESVTIRVWYPHALNTRYGAEGARVLVRLGPGEKGMLKSKVMGSLFDRIKQSRVITTTTVIG